MLGVLVVGDVRLHYAVLKDEPTDRSPTDSNEFGATARNLDNWIPGGAYMVADLMQLALFDRSKDGESARENVTELFRRLTKLLTLLPFRRTRKPTHSRSIVPIAQKLAESLSRNPRFSQGLIKWIQNLVASTEPAARRLERIRGPLRNPAEPLKAIAKQVADALLRFPAPPELSRAVDAFVDWLREIQSRKASRPSDKEVEQLRVAIAEMERRLTPVLLSYSEPEWTGNSTVEPYWDYSWTLEKADQLRSGRPRFVLSNPIRRNNSQAAPVPDIGAKSGVQHLRLSPSDSYEMKDYNPELGKVDILVIDDLDRGYRQLTSDEQSIHRHIVGTVLNEFEQRLDKTRTLGHPEDSAPLLQPMVLVCLKVVPDSTKNDVDESYWGTLLSTDRLGDRTVVILDADNLRRDGMHISESRSWELSSQDFIDELQKNARIAGLRRVGHIVVRFGATGVLYVRRTHCDWDSRLYFLPEQDDRAMTSDADGTILGYGAVLAAALVRALWCRCDDAGNSPFVNALPEVMEDGLIHGLKACNLLCRIGYGKNPTENELFDRKVQLADFSKSREQWFRGFPRALFLKTLLYDEKLRAASRKGMDEPDGTTIATIGVTPVFAPPTPKWSFLSHSCRNRVAETALDVASFGVDRIMNLPVWVPRRMTQSIVHHLSLQKFVDSLQKHLTNLAKIELEKPERFLKDWKTLREKLLKSIVDEIRKCDSISSRTIHVQENIHLRCARFTGENDDNSIDGWIQLYLPGVKAQIEEIESGKPGRKAAALKKMAVILKKGAKPPARDQLTSNVNRLIKHLSRAFEDSFWPVHAPIVKYGSRAGESGQSLPMIVVDRREIEGYRTLENLIRAHLTQFANSFPSIERPLSIALFGPPGAGKSFAIKRIVETIQPIPKPETLTFNLSEYSEVNQLASAFDQITQVIARRAVPLVFFDEFDSSLGDTEVAWLKSFLTPMEDGTYQGNTVKSAIFVFAGGTCSTFEEFSRHSRTRTDPHWIKFATSKGPDFVSRLQGHMDLMGVNPTGAEDDLYLIRRAVFLRSRLDAMKLTGTDGVSRIDRDLLYALLHAPAYRHGGRSMRIILELCKRNGEIRRSTIPAISQLDMHVDGKAFVDLIARGAPPTHRF